MKQREREILEDAKQGAPKQTLRLYVACLLPVLFLVPFLTKAYHIDDTLFIWAAKHIRTHPLDFYGFPINWYGFEMPMYQVNQNPPLISYYIAFVSFFTGWEELPLHVAFLAPALGLSIGIYFLSKSFCSMPWLAVSASLLTPVFMVSGTNIMTDTTMLAFYVWAIALWVRGLDENRNAFLFWAAILVALSAATKYFGITLAPLLLAYSLACKRRFDSHISFLLIPIALLSVYQLMTFHMYGEGLLFNAATYAAGAKDIGIGQLFSRLIIGLAFTGGCIITISLFSPLLLSRRTWGMLLGVFLPMAVFFTFHAHSFGNFTFHQQDNFQWGAWIQFLVMVFSGMVIFVLVGMDLWENRDEKSLLLFLWFFGTFCFATFVNWTANARTVYPMAPCAGIVLARFLAKKFIIQKIHISKIIAPPLAAGALISLAVAWADYSLADCQRTAAHLFHSKLTGYPHNVWFEGHWGFQYYMEKKGMKALDFQNSGLKQGDVLIIPANNTNVKSPRKDIFHFADSLRVMPFPWLGTMQKPLGAGFYSDVWGPLPFVSGDVPPEEYAMYLVGKYDDPSEAIEIFNNKWEWDGFP